jgi:hypothetical protein
VVLVANKLGLKGDMPLDVKTGMDFMLKQYRDLSIIRLEIQPPCTDFSQIQQHFNNKAMMSQRGKLKGHTAIIWVTHSMDCARVQVVNNRILVFERPWRATSWKPKCVTDIMGLEDARTVMLTSVASGRRRRSPRLLCGRGLSS